MPSSMYSFPQCTIRSITKILAVGYFDVISNLTLEVEVLRHMKIECASHMLKIRAS